MYYTCTYPFVSLEPCGIADLVVGSSWILLWLLSNPDWLNFGLNKHDSKTSRNPLAFLSMFWPKNLLGKLILHEGICEMARRRSGSIDSQDTSFRNTSVDFVPSFKHSFDLVILISFGSLVKSKVQTHTSLGASMMNISVMTDDWPYAICYDRTRLIGYLRTVDTDFGVTVGLASTSQP